MDVDDVLAKPWSWLAGYMRFVAVEPQGEERADMRMARTVFYIAAPHQEEHKRPKSLKPYLFDFEGREDDESDEAQARAMRRWAIRTGGRIA